MGAFQYLDVWRYRFSTVKKILAFLLIFFCGAASAVLPPPVDESIVTYFMEKNGQKFSGTEANAVCVQWAGDVGGFGGGTVAKAIDGSCQACNAGGCVALAVINKKTENGKRCKTPNSNMVSESECVCASGFEEKNGSCVRSNDERCKDLAGKKVWADLGKTVPIPGIEACGGTAVGGQQSQCGGKVEGGACGVRDGVRHCEGYVTFSGGGCTGTPVDDATKNPEEVPDCQSGQKSVVAGKVVCKPATSDWSKLPVCGQFEKSVVDGQVVCRPPADRNIVESFDKKSTNTTNKDGSPVRRDVVTRTTCYGSKCVTTTETTDTVVNPDASDGPSTTETNTEPPKEKDSFCVENPDASICKKSTASMGCGSFSCDGDAVQCAIAQELNKRNCQLWEEEKGESLYSKAVAGADEADPAKLRAEAKAAPVDVGTLDFSGKGWSRSCPDDPRIPMPWANEDLVLEFSKLCGPLGIAADIAVLITALGCVVFVVGKGTA